MNPPGSSMMHDHGSGVPSFGESITQTWSVPITPSDNPMGRQSFYQNSNLHVKAEWLGDGCQPLPGPLRVVSGSPGYPHTDRR